MTEESNAIASGGAHASDQRFTDYYAEQSQTEAGWLRCRTVRDAVFGTYRRVHGDEAEKPLDVLDVGCNAGTLCMAWAELGHSASGVEINGPLLEIAKQRALERGAAIDYRLGSAVDIPISAASQDICIALELLEHVEDWKACLDEFARVLRPGGLMLVTTTNVLCPIQQEFNLPLYSWFPAPLKRYVVHLSKTSRPSLANYAKYPAVHWFSYYSLRRAIEPLGFQCWDRFDAMDLEPRGRLTQLIVRGVRCNSVMRFLAQVLSGGSTVFAIKNAAVVSASAEPVSRLQDGSLAPGAE